jgi:hypothetical protein
VRYLLYCGTDPATGDPALVLLSWYFIDYSTYDAATNVSRWAYKDANATLPNPGPIIGPHDNMPATCFLGGVLADCSSITPTAAPGLNSDTGAFADHFLFTDPNFFGFSVPPVYKYDLAYLPTAAIGNPLNVTFTFGHSGAIYPGSAAVTITGPV